MSFAYANEKLYTAALILATGQGGIHERLESAFAEQLIRLLPEDIPKDIREDFDEVNSALTRVKAKGTEGDIAASIKELSEEEAARLAEKIFNMFAEVASSRPRR
jgi:hypothetical protein